MSGNNISLPRVNATLSGKNPPQGVSQQRVLFVGQKTGSATAVSGELVTDIQNDPILLDNLFGRQSDLAKAIKSFRATNLITNIDVISLDDDGAAVQATGAIVVTGTATAAGELVVAVGSYVNNKYTVPVALNDTPTLIGDKIAAAINGDTTGSVTAVNTAGSIALTAVSGGEIGNEIGLGYDGMVAGVTVALTGFSGGSANPDLTGLFDPVEMIRYQGVIWPAIYGLDEVGNFLDPRFNVTNEVKDGRAFSVLVDTFANYVTIGDALNSSQTVGVANKLETTGNQRGGTITELSLVDAAQVAAVVFLRLEPNANIASIMSAIGRDNTGGPALSSLPFFNTLLANLPLVQSGRGFSDEEVIDLNDSGWSVCGNNQAGNSVITGELLTFYKTQANGTEDLTFEFLNSVTQASIFREYVYTQIKSDFAQSRLVDGTGAALEGRALATQASIRAAVLRYNEELSGPDFAITSNSNEGLQAFSENLFITINQATGLVNITANAYLVGQARAFNFNIGVVLGGA